MEELPKRRHPRLKAFDYTQGWYFVTVCTAGKRKILCDVVGRGALTPPQVRLSLVGRVVEKHILRTNTLYPTATIDKYVIMPNHVHLIIAIHSPDGGVRAPRPTHLSSVVRSIKAMVTREIGHTIWQTSFYDHVIRSEADYLRIWQYMDENPVRWTENEYYFE